MSDACVLSSIIFSRYSFKNRTFKFRSSCKFHSTSKQKCNHCRICTSTAFCIYVFALRLSCTFLEFTSASVRDGMSKFQFIFKAENTFELFKSLLRFYFLKLNLPLSRTLIEGKSRSLSFELCKFFFPRLCNSR